MYFFLDLLRPSAADKAKEEQVIEALASHEIACTGCLSCLLEARQGHVASAVCFLLLHVSAAASFAGPWRTGNPLLRPGQPQLSAARPARQLRCLMRQLCSLNMHLHRTLASGGSSLVRRVPHMLFLLTTVATHKPSAKREHRDLHLTAVPFGRLFSIGQACRKKSLRTVVRCSYAPRPFRSSAGCWRRREVVRA